MPLFRTGNERCVSLMAWRKLSAFLWHVMRGDSISSPPPFQEHALFLELIA